MRLFFLLFITVPILEMWLLIEVGSKIGALSTIFLVFLTAAIGLALLRQQGLDTLLRVNQRMAQGQLPAGEIMEGVALAVGGALLLTPGFMTDAIGFACLIPLSRKLIVAGLLSKGINFVASGHTSFGQGPAGARGPFQSGRATSQAGKANWKQHADSSPKGPTTIEGDYRRED